MGRTLKFTAPTTAGSDLEGMKKKRPCLRIPEITAGFGYSQQLPRIFKKLALDPETLSTQTLHLATDAFMPKTNYISAQFLLEGN